MNLSHNENIILYVIERTPGLGKTAAMKILYFLQQVKQMRLGYDFDIYTYGPYTSEVTDNLDTLISSGLIKSTQYSVNNSVNSYVGYELNISESGKEVIKELPNEDQNSIQDVLDFTKGKPAKTLELYSTIVFINQLYLKNKIPNNQEIIIDKVHEIKPHFDNKVILEAYNRLYEKKYI